MSDGCRFKTLPHTKARPRMNNTRDKRRRKRRRRSRKKKTKRWRMTKRRGRNWDHIEILLRSYVSTQSASTNEQRDARFQAEWRAGLQIKS
jgi:hypothetical protein